MTEYKNTPWNGDMSTAPRDGKAILVRTSACWGGCAVVEWGGDDGWWMLDDGKCAYEIPLRGEKPTGWMYLPCVNGIE